MPTECVPMGQCGTRYPMWMSGRLPADGKIAVVEGCINTEDDGCCNEKFKIVVRNCGDYYVYHLPALPRCVRPAAYCTERGQWMMVFKAVSGVQPDPYALWMSRESLNENVPEAARIGSGFRGHFKSQLVQEWNSMNAAEVRLSLYEAGAEVLRVVFDGSGIDKTSWFNLDRIVSSPYRDLGVDKSDLPDIQIMTTSQNYRFVMSRSARSDCQNANGWLLVVASAGECNWDRTGDFPVFKYSRSGSATLWDSENDQVGEADELVIYMRTEEEPVCKERSYQVLREQARGPGGLNILNNVDDSRLQPGWYRFTSPTGEELSHYCRELNSCGAQYSIWLLDAPRTEPGETVKGTMCINKDEPGCCNEQIKVLIRNCGSFFIYRLPQLKSMGWRTAGYCTGFNEWNLVLRGVSSSRYSAGNLYELWASHESWNADRDSAQITAPWFPEHFKSSLVEDWDRLHVQQVRLSLYKYDFDTGNHTEVRRFIFDGRGSDRFSWFSPERIMETPYKDMKINTTYSQFSLGSSHSRQFVINKMEIEAESCPGSSGWLAVIHNSDDCLWQGNAFTNFVYSGQDAAVNWDEGPVETADVLAVFVRSPLLHNPCREGRYTVITDTRRSADILRYSGRGSVDDRSLQPGWYRMTDDKGAKLNIATSCVEVDYCGTHYPIWINDKLPETPGERKPLTGCINTEEDGCCNQKIILGAIHCGDYILFGLDQVPSILGNDEPAAYCTEADQWELVFKMRDGFLGPLWGVPPSSINTDIPLARQLDNEFLGNYKTSRASWLSSQSINKVKLAIYKDGKERITLIFDGESASDRSWFSDYRLIFSPWTDLSNRSTHAIFLMEGEQMLTEYGTRRWLITKEHIPCSEDSEGWLMVITDPGRRSPCDLRKPRSILYSNTTTAENWSSGSLERGDFMAIFVSSSSDPRRQCRCGEN
ncbi:uncharacterized protein LOC110983420 [Acanthaster planci]|uniref:Uncharacterized protein LOC110983420 n=1 Tax=Acanthaster planci TaxID=133434 RepID=A0A8B7Z0Q2_ACAPL|nr:uncharacterized protein LOC110983420 [Acanthaster planci]